MNTAPAGGWSEFWDGFHAWRNAQHRYDLHALNEIVEQERRLPARCSCATCSYVAWLRRRRFRRSEGR